MPATTTIPDFAYIGTSKAGSTWLFNALAGHPDVYLASDKGLYYFDQHFDEGPQWYLDHFRSAGDQAAVGEISHSYLSSPAAGARIAEFNPGMRLLVCLREPVDRAFSDYLDLVKNGQYDGPFAAALEKFPRLLDRGRYATHLQRYLDLFPRSQLHVSLFDDLRADPQAYADEVFAFLGARRLELPPADLKSRMPAGRPRSAAVAAAAKSASKLAKRTGLRRLRSRVKRSIVVRQALYRPYKDDRPTVDPALAAELRQGFADEVLRLDSVLGRPVSELWGYSSAPAPAADRSQPFPGR
ncbi:sulfotransferase [Blastococcus sp. BMG 814]|uniref:Sulfotransferase n=1 Tax=Blastococcus carthaginiensis TaxID=3050034 RepID=A0ABT9IDW8_9ACTN|nr:sulfotransferase domain-containing protein [Blastococcus carthaginiensis]MDP5183782.1 sulfotransferase [Blastococcus carthaginiensis]